MKKPMTQLTFFLPKFTVRAYLTISMTNLFKHLIDIISSIQDPEKPFTLEQLNVVQEDLMNVYYLKEDNQ
jgi:hypothetical protein